MRLPDHIRVLADEWARVTGRSTARLGTLVVNDGKFFNKLEEGRANFTVSTLEKLLAFFRDGANWPDNRIPFAASETLGALENIAHEDGVSPDNSCDGIGVAA